MQGLLFMLGSFVIEGGLVALVMYLLTEPDRQRRRREAARPPITTLEAAEELPKAA